jgi:hypothetical protein
LHPNPFFKFIFERFVHIIKKISGRLALLLGPHAGTPRTFYLPHQGREPLLGGYKDWQGDIKRQSLFPSSTCLAIFSNRNQAPLIIAFQTVLMAYIRVCTVSNNQRKIQMEIYQASVESLCAVFERLFARFRRGICCSTKKERIVPLLTRLSRGYFWMGRIRSRQLSNGSGRRAIVVNMLWGWLVNNNFVWVRGKKMKKLKRVMTAMSWCDAHDELQLPRWVFFVKSHMTGWKSHDACKNVLFFPLFSTMTIWLASDI